MERVLILGGLAVALSMPNPLSAQISQAGTSREADVALPWVLTATWVVLLGAGLRASWLRRFRRLLQQRGWFLWGTPRGLW
jgi:hypothetical protein